MDDDMRMEVLENLLREARERNKVLWVQKAEAQAAESRHLWMRDVWWAQRKPDISEYYADELDAVIDAHRAGKTPPPSRRSKFDEWDPDKGKSGAR